MMKSAISIFVVIAAFSFSVKSQDLCIKLKNARIIAQDSENTYLGTVSNKHSSESIFNEYGKFGSEFRTTSIWNEHSSFGSKHRIYSAFNDHSNKPPKIVKNGYTIGYLTTNKFKIKAINPFELKGQCKDKF